MIQGGAPASPLMGSGLHFNMAPGLDGVTDIAVIADPVAHVVTLRSKVMPSLLPGLGTLSPWPIGAIVGGVATASPR